MATAAAAGPRSRPGVAGQHRGERGHFGLRQSGGYAEGSGFRTASLGPIFVIVVPAAVLLVIIYLALARLATWVAPPKAGSTAAPVGGTAMLLCWSRSSRSKGTQGHSRTGEHLINGPAPLPSSPPSGTRHDAID